MLTDTAAKLKKEEGTKSNITASYKLKAIT
jgi:hypothetical protein